VAVHVRVLVGCTVPPYKADHDEYVTAWLIHAAAMQEFSREYGHEVEFFVALEVDARGNGLQDALLRRLAAVGGWRVEFRYDNGADYLTNEDRINRICMGRNLVTEQGLIGRYDAILFLDSDTMAPPESVVRMLNVTWPIVGGHVPTYGLTGPRVKTYHQIVLQHGREFPFIANPRLPWEFVPDDAIPSSDAQVHWNTAGFLLVHRVLFRRLRWYWDLDDGLTDDPAYQRDARETYGFHTVVLHDLVGEHFPRSIGPLASRGHDLSLRSVIQ